MVVQLSFKGDYTVWKCVRVEHYPVIEEVVPVSTVFDKLPDKATTASGTVGFLH